MKSRFPSRPVHLKQETLAAVLVPTRCTSVPASCVSEREEVCQLHQPADSGWGEFRLGDRQAGFSVHHKRRTRQVARRLLQEKVGVLGGCQSRPRRSRLAAERRWPKSFSLARTTSAMSAFRQLVFTKDNTRTLPDRENRERVNVSLVGQGRGEVQILFLTPLYRAPYFEGDHIEKEKRE